MDVQVKFWLPSSDILDVHSVGIVNPQLVFYQPGKNLSISTVLWFEIVIENCLQRTIWRTTVRAHGCV